MVSIGITEEAITALSAAVYSYIRAGISAAERGPRDLTTNGVKMSIPVCLVDTG